MMPINSGFVFTDPEDLRYQRVTALRNRWGQFLHRASVTLRQQDDANTIDAIMMLVRSGMSSRLTVV